MIPFLVEATNYGYHSDQSQDVQNKMAAFRKSFADGHIGIAISKGHWSHIAISGLANIESILGYLDSMGGDEFELTFHLAPRTSYSNTVLTGEATISIKFIPNDTMYDRDNIKWTLSAISELRKSRAKVIAVNLALASMHDMGMSFLNGCQYQAHLDCALNGELRHGLKDNLGGHVLVSEMSVEHAMMTVVPLANGTLELPEGASINFPRDEALRLVHTYNVFNSICAGLESYAGLDTAKLQSEIEKSISKVKTVDEAIEAMREELVSEAMVLMKHKDIKPAELDLLHANIAEMGKAELKMREDIAKNRELLTRNKELEDECNDYKQNYMLRNTCKFGINSAKFVGDLHTAELILERRLQLEEAERNIADVESNCRASMYPWQQLASKNKPHTAISKYTPLMLMTISIAGISSFITAAILGAG